MALYHHCYVVELTDMYFTASQAVPLFREAKAKALTNDAINARLRNNGFSEFFGNTQKREP